MIGDEQFSLSPKSQNSCWTNITLRLLITTHPFPWDLSPVAATCQHIHSEECSYSFNDSEEFQVLRKQPFFLMKILGTMERK